MNTIKWITLREALNFIADGIPPLDMELTQEEEQKILPSETLREAKLKLVKLCKEGRVRVAGLAGEIEICFDRKMDYKYYRLTLLDDKVADREKKIKISRSCRSWEEQGKLYYPGIRENFISTTIFKETPEALEAPETPETPETPENPEAPETETPAEKSQKRAMNEFKDEEVKRKEIEPKNLDKFILEGWDECYNFIRTPLEVVGDKCEATGYGFVEVDYEMLIRAMRNEHSNSDKAAKNKQILELAKKLYPEEIGDVKLSDAVRGVMDSLSQNLKGARGYGEHSVRRCLQDMLRSDDSPYFKVRHKEI